MENECTSHIFGSFAIFLPKIIKIGGNLTQFWQKQICLVFWGTRCRKLCQICADILCGHSHSHLFAYFYAWHIHWLNKCVTSFAKFLLIHIIKLQVYFDTSTWTTLFLTMVYVFCRLMSQFADVNIQSNVGMFTFVIFYIWCSFFLFAIKDRAELCMSEL